MSEPKRAAGELQENLFITSDEIFSATHLRIPYHAVEECVFERVLCWLLETNTFGAMETNIFRNGVWMEINTLVLETNALKTRIQTPATHS